MQKSACYTGTWLVSASGQTFGVFVRRNSTSLSSVTTASLVSFPFMVYGSPGAG
eukprot:m.55615 g.55615  ORF g.55615 m.55615 type:complete len:54 (-) comp10993_c0_seq3:1926-2087(-)